MQLSDIPLVSSGHRAPYSLLCAHGFGSHKDAPTILAIRDTLPPHIDCHSFDFPSHGGNKKPLSLSACLLTLRLVEAEVLRQNPETKLCFFGSSFGAYLTLLHLHQTAQYHLPVFLRAAAIEMGSIMEDMLEEEADAIPFLPSPSGDPQAAYWDLSDYYNPPILLTKGCVDELKDTRLLPLYEGIRLPYGHMVHGSDDPTAPFADAARFAEHVGATLCAFPGGGHRLMETGEQEEVMRQLVHFLEQNFAANPWGEG